MILKHLRLSRFRCIYEDQHLSGLRSTVSSYSIPSLVIANHRKSNQISQTSKLSILKMEYNNVKRLINGYQPLNLVGIMLHRRFPGLEKRKSFNINTTTIQTDADLKIKFDKMISFMYPQHYYDPAFVPADQGKGSLFLWREFTKDVDEIDIHVSCSVEYAITVLDDAILGNAITFCYSLNNYRIMSSPDKIT